MCTTDSCYLRRLVVLAYLVFLLGTCSRLLAGGGQWNIAFDSMDLTAAASPIPVADEVLVNVTAIGPILGITVQPDDSGSILRTSDGQTWRCEAGGTVINSDARMVSLGSPAVQQGFSLFISSHAVAEIGQLLESVDDRSRRITFSRGREDSSEVVLGVLGDGWKTFTVPKPQNAKPAPVRRPTGKIPVANTPPLREKLNVGLGLGYVQGADWGLQATASGRLLGGDTRFGALITQGVHGTVLQSSHLRWVDGEKRIGVEAGDLYSEIWGFVRGARYVWDIQKANPRSALSVYLETGRAENPHPLVAYRRDVQVTNGLKACIEIGSDGANYTNLIWELGRAGVYGYRRSLPDGFGHSEGFLASTQLPSGFSIAYSLNSSLESDGRTTDSSTIGLRWPLWRTCSLTLDQTHYDYDDRSMTQRSVGLILPLNRSVHVSIRYQQHAIDFTPLLGPQYPGHSESSGLYTSMSLSAGRRMSLDYQRSTYTRDGFAQSHEQLLTNYRLSPRTSFQLISGFPNISDTDRLKLRVNHRLSDDTSLLLEYGRQAPFQSDTDIAGEHGLMIMVKKTWPLMVHSRGGEVRGSVLDQIGRPVSNVAVRLGKYTALTNSEGEYEIRCMPSGNYTFGLAPESIPADCRSDSAPQEIEVSRDSSIVRDFRLVPLGSVSGLVYLDRNLNGQFDSGEGMSDIPVCADDQATATLPDGRFSFYNLEPGKHLIRIASEVMDGRYAVQGRSSVEIELRPAEAVTGLEFQLAIRQKPILFVQTN